MKAVLGLGTNLGDREGNMAAALDALEKLPCTQLLAMSNMYETAPFDVVSAQADYLNCCVLLETGLDAQALLGRCLGIETEVGRVRTEYHGARTMDIDLPPPWHFTAGLCDGAPVRPVPWLPGPPVWV